MTEQGNQNVDLIIECGVVVTMDDDHTILDDGAVAIDGNRTVAIDSTSAISAQYTAKRVMSAVGKVIMPRLVDTYAHAGHGMIKGGFRPHIGWPLSQIYWHATIPDWWYAEAMLSGMERVRFGTTTGASIYWCNTRTRR